jgi:carboxymethylenebutenolidase
VRQYLVEEELEHYRDGWITRREFIRRAALIGVSAAVATAMADTVVPAQAAPMPSASQTSPFHVDEGDARVRAEMISYPSDDGAQISAYLAWPARGTMNRSLPGVAISHANQGLRPHFMDVARRFAVQGYVAIAPDQISRVGVSSLKASADERRAGYASLDPAQTARDMLAALEVLKEHAGVDPSKLAATGYCAGGSITWRLATIAPDLVAAAPFYGNNPPLNQVSNIRAAVFGVYGELDDRVNAGIPAIEAALQAAGAKYAITVYPDSRHAFHDDTGRAYNPDTAQMAWVDTLNWFAENLWLEAPRV